ncbi:MAG: acyl-CoA dehydratase activase [Chloroflexota bacterium]|nr:acyl-CoA dehydratase activase [Chloroflexota bacterium]
MIVAGIDIGSRAAKAVLMKDGEIASTVIGDTLPDSVMTSTTTMSSLLEGTGLTIDNIDYIVATGYGRVLVPFAKENVSEISCHARGINWYFPSVRTILDMGGQDCKAISCDGEGRVTKFVMNDKCAGGTGRFLEMIAEVLGATLEEAGRLAVQSKNVVPFNTICAVFAKTEAIAYRRKGIEKGDILAGLNEAIAQRSLNLLKRVSIEKDFSITGGIAKNRGMVDKLTEKVGLEPLLCDDPQLIGAIGAALFAGERFKGTSSGGVEIQYGYSDATGDYFITIDTARCDACGDCVDACPEGVFAIVQQDGTAPHAAVREEIRKRLGYVCPGVAKCKADGANCHRACSRDAIGHSW